MSSQVSVRRESEDQLYRKMRISQLGVMLLVRLHADLSEAAVMALRRFRDLTPEVDPLTLIDEGTRLGVTVSWLVKQFGPRNALRAIQEASREILQAIPASR